jgi:hypothetical protein
MGWMDERDGRKEMEGKKSRRKDRENVNIYTFT